MVSLPNGIRNYQNLGLVVIAVIIGIIYPTGGRYLEPVITPLVVFLIYSSLRGVGIDSVTRISYVRFIGLAICLSYFVFPVVGSLLVNNIPLPNTARLGFQIAFAVPATAGSAIIWTRFAGGDTQLATVISIVSLGLSPIFTPVVLNALSGAQTEVPVISILTNLFVIVAGGSALAGLIPDKSVSKATIDSGAMIAIAVIIYASVAGVRLHAISFDLFFTIICISLSLIGVGFLIAMSFERWWQLGRKQTLPLFFTVNLKNLGIALVIALPYTSSLVVFTIVTYYIIQQLIASLIADTLKGDSIASTPS